VYEAFFGLADAPFRLTPDPRYLYLSPKHAEALAHLRAGLVEPGGFVCITGDIGTGKTTLLRAFLETSGPSPSRKARRRVDGLRLQPDAIRAGPAAADHPGSRRSRGRQEP